MAIVSLIGKDLREHRLPAVFLTLGSLAIVLMLLERNAVASFSMSPFEIVRFALLSFIPLLALIVGNRLVVNEYLSGTRHFIEALPIGSGIPLLLKYLLGLTYLGGIAVLMIVLAARQAGIADDATPAYVMLLSSKTLVMTALYWSVVFCFSLCGHLRLALYLLLAALVALIAWYPGIDAQRIAPFALMDEQLFVFERDIVPWRDIAGTALLALAFTLAGFILTRVGEGALVDRLARPLTRRDFVALGILSTSGVALWTALLEENDHDPVAFASDKVVNLNDARVSVLYLEEQFLDAAEEMASRIAESLDGLQSSLGLPELPRVRLSLAPTREADDIDYSTADDVSIAGNWLDNDSYDDAVFDSVVMHGVLSSLTDGRAMFEPYHWVLDGFTRWWVEQGMAAIDPSHKAELIARAVWALDADPQVSRLSDHWQFTADRFAYPTAESLAWAAMSYLEETQGRGKVLALANEFLVRPVGRNALVSLRDRLDDAQSRVEDVTGLAMSEFEQGWQHWLRQQQDDPQVSQYLQLIPALQGVVVSSKDESGVYSIEAYYERRQSTLPLNEDIGRLAGRCVLKHDYIGPFDSEFEVTDDYEDVQACSPGEPVHVINSLYAPGDRVFIALDYENGGFHQPLRLHAERMSVQ